jgi:hypothetical protein
LPLAALFAVSSLVIFVTPVVVFFGFAKYAPHRAQVRPTFSELHFLLAMTHHITTSDNFVNPTTNIVL